MVCAFALGEKLMGFGYPFKKIGGLLLFTVICPCKNLKKTLYKNTMFCEV
jgi:hypothetical protein